jgi:hypothetical protein
MAAAVVAVTPPERGMPCQACALMSTGVDYTGRFKVESPLAAMTRAALYTK